MRLKAKTDANHGEIVKALRAVGCSVCDLSRVGKGCPDLLVTEPSWPFDTALFEVKDGAKPPSARQLTPDQEKFHAAWKGRIHVVMSVAEALDAVTKP